MRKGSAGDRWEVRRLMGDLQVTHSLRGKHHTARSKRHTGGQCRENDWSTWKWNNFEKRTRAGHEKGGFWINISLLAWMKEEEEKLDKNISSRWNGCL